MLGLWKGDKLVGGAVCKMHTGNFQLGYRAYDTTIRIKNLSLGYILEYEYFLYGLSHDVQVFSRGKSANIAGYLGTAIGVGLHKMSLGFLPVVYTTKNTQIEFDETSITGETLIFTQYEDYSFTHAAVRTTRSPEQAAIFYNVLIKRGIQVTYTYL